MANYWNQAIMIWQDLNGQQGQSVWTTQDQTDTVPSDIVSLGANAQALSSCKLVAIQKVTTHLIGGSGVGGDYPTFWDRATLLTRMPASYGHIEIPGPLGSIFTDDHNSVDMSNPLVQAFANQVYATMGDKLGRPVVSVYKGARSRARSGGNW